MKTKRSGVLAVLTAVLLVSALLVTNCMESLGSIKSSDEANGKSIIKVNTGDYSRTIMPDITSIDEFTSFTVNIYEEDNGSFTTLVDSDTATSPTDLNGIEFELDTGEFYDIEVIAYNTGTIIAARGVELNYEADGNDTISITLLPITTGNVTTGTFIYTFVAPNVTPYTADLTVTKVGGSAVITRNLVGGGTPAGLTNATNPDTLEPGSYDVIVAVSAANHKTMAFNSSLIIAQGQPSTLAATDGQLPDPLLNVYTLNFDYNESGSPTTGSITGIPHGQVAIGTGRTSTFTTGGGTNTAAFPNTTLNGVTAPVGTFFGGWWLDPTAAEHAITNPEFTASSLIVLNDLTLTAKWVANMSDIGFNVSYTPITAGDPIITSSSFAYYHSSGDGSLTFSLSNLGAFDGGSVTWTLNNDAPVVENTFTLEFNKTAFIDNMIAGKHILVAKGTVGALQRSASVEITIAATAP